MMTYDEWFASLPTEKEAISKSTCVTITFEESKARCGKEVRNTFKHAAFMLAKNIRPRINLRIK